ncbi:MAG: 4Fe-4S binding protein [Gemmatimonadetes bacterium]|nr:4Fe-4S binding protein [Gemmatimonadota bacterium]
MTPRDRRNLLGIPVVKALLHSRWPQLVARLLALAGLLVAILAAVVGSPVGSHNIGIVLVWIAWWALLILLILPVFGRGWCAVCPIPMPAEWLQHGAVLGPGGPGIGLKRRMPAALRNIWLQNVAFTGLALCSAVVLTQPRVTGWVLLLCLLVALGMGLVYERRSFCRYVCPVGGFIGLYAQLAPVGLRVRDTSRCASHTEKTCFVGSADGFGCPWMLFPGAVVKNTYCGLCMECVRTCPHDNIVLNLRPVGADLCQPRGRRLDEAFKAFIMLGAAMVYSAVMLGPWGALKAAAYEIGSQAWLQYAVSFVSLVYGVLPALFLLSVAVGKRLAGSTVPLRALFVALSYALVPLGLAAWIAFSLSFVFASISYLWATVSDPLGAGWNLFGTAHLGWQPYVSGGVPYLQAAVLLVGLTWASVTARRISAEQHAPRVAPRLALPVAGFCLVVTVALMKLLII